MIVGTTENGSLFFGLVPGELVNRLLAGERVHLRSTGGPRPTPATWLSLDASRDDVTVERGFAPDGAPTIAMTGREVATRLLDGERVCIEREGPHPHICLFYRATNDELIEATAYYFPSGLTPDAVIVHAGGVEPNGVAR